MFKNYNRNLTTFPYNFEINYVCDEGYRLIGSSWRGCGTYGWTKQAPICEEIRCPDPGTPENGRVQGYNYSVGSIIEFGCYSGYQLLGSSRRVCMKNGQWSGELSRCNRKGNHCPNPGIPIGGSKIGNRYDFGSEVTFHCNPDRILIGSALRICQKNGEWSGEEAKCLSQYDFDDKRVVGVKIKSLLKEEKLNQKVKVDNYMSQMESNDTEFADNRGRAIDLNYPGRLIFIFIFDVSGSVGEMNFNRSKDFAKAMVKVIGVSEDGTRVGVITFSSKASTEFNPFDYKNMDDVLEALDKLKYKKGGTATSSALSLIRENMMPLSLEVLGKNSKVIVFLMTDGKANMAGDPIHDAQTLKDIGVEIYCVGITGDRRMGTLNDIATSKEEHVFILDSYDSMDWLVQEIVNDTIDYSKCGIRQWAVVELEEEDARGRVVNGLSVTKSWPWMAAILFVDPVTRNANKASGLCGGSLIAPMWILTAAHCMHDKIGRLREKNELIVNLGVIDLRVTRNAQERSVLRYITHPNYDRKTFDNDIALIELNKPAKYNEFVRPVCLPPNESDLQKEPTFYRAGRRAAVVGWGYDKKLKESEANDAHHIKESKWLVLTLQNRETCEDSLRIHPDYSFTKQMICAGGEGKDVCHGDSGGPLMQSLESDIGETYWTEVGIVSWGIGCAQPNTYGFYTKVSMFVNWIKDTINK